MTADTHLDMSAPVIVRYPSGTKRTGVVVETGLAGTLWVLEHGEVEPVAVRAEWTEPLPPCSEGAVSRDGEKCGRRWS